jgi:hypothetical protein
MPRRAVHGPGESPGGPSGEPPPDLSQDLAAALAAALVAELAQRSGVCWVRHGEGTHPVWHVWCDGALCLVTGGDEQPLPDLADGDRVEVVMRSKDTGGRLLTWVGEVSVVRSGDEEWAATTAALVAGRLNLRDPATAAEDWARRSVVLRVVPRFDPDPVGPPA